MVVFKSKSGACDVDRLGIIAVGGFYVAEPFIPVEAEFFQLRRRGGAEPPFEFVGAHDIRGERSFEMRGDFVDVEEFSSSALIGKLFQLGENSAVLFHDGRRVREFSEDETVQKKESSRKRGIDAAVIASSALYDNEPVESDALLGS